MTRIIESLQENKAGSTVTSTSATNAILTATHTGVASTEYMIFAFIKVNKADITTDLNVRLHNATAAVTYQTATIELKDTTDELCLMLLGNYTAAGTPVSNTIELRVWCETSGTITWKEASLFLIKKDATDAVASSTGDSTTALTPIDKISQGITPATTGNYLICYSVECRTADTDFPPMIARLDIDGSDVTGTERRITGQDVTSRHALHAMCVQSLASGSARDIDLECVGAGGSIDNVTFSNARLFIIRLDSFDDHGQVYVNGTDQNSVNDTYEDVPSATLTKTLVAVDWLILSSCYMSVDIITQSYLGKFQESIGGSNSDRVTWLQETYVAADKMPYSMGYKLDATAVEHIWKFQHAPESTAVITTGGNMIVALQVEANTGATGTAAFTTAGVSVSASGTETMTGTFARTLAGVSVAASGVVDAVGTAAITLAGVSNAASGTETITGTSAPTLAGVSIAASGRVDAVGTAAFTTAGVSSAASATETITGTAAFTLATVSIAASGAETFTGTFAATLNGVAVSAAGVVDATGTAAITLAGVSTSGAGAETITGTSSITLAGVSVAAAGAETFAATAAFTTAAISIAAAGTVTAAPDDITGTAAITLAGVSIAASGAETFTGTASITLGGVSTAAAGAETITGTATFTLAGVSVAAAATETMTGTGAATLANATAAASGAETITGTAAPTLAGVSIAATGTQTITGTATITLAGVSTSVTGVETITGTCSITLANATGTGQGSQGVTGSLAVTLAGVTIAAVGTVLRANRKMYIFSSDTGFSQIGF